MGDCHDQNRQNPDAVTLGGGAASGTSTSTGRLAQARFHFTHALRRVQFSKGRRQP